ncbi:hypothetical protein PR202_ga06056 [Eleusine coracana subsp. coracana]|uniref:DUF6598 domain-containing protein n=1 Tax=Eleusine coracana subsp. coracana TaxID=191504 RepID=A0AAV5BTU5_ELECO|nr:hypothetical protein PR202_ga06056 [Eleusine coracana subsp. coracana]
MEFDDGDSEYCSLELDVDPDQDFGFDSELDPDWDNHVLSWEELVAKALHIVRLHQITEYDPVQCSLVQTRFCKYNLAYFDFDKESKAKPGTPFLELTSHQHNLLEESVNVVSLKVLKSDVGYPIRVFGTVLARDQVDYKCIYLFRRQRDDPQVINSPIKDDACGDDRVLSKGVIEHDTCISNGEKLMEQDLTSWHSTVQLAYTPVPYAITASYHFSEYDAGAM